MLAILFEANQLITSDPCPSMIYTCTCISFSVSSPANAPKFQCTYNPTKKRAARATAGPRDRASSKKRRRPSSYRQR